MRTRKDGYVMIDIECSGTRLGHHDLIQFGGVILCGDQLEERIPFPLWQLQQEIPINLVKPWLGNTPNPASMEVNGLDYQICVDFGMDPQDFLQRFNDWVSETREIYGCEKMVICGHGVVFDWSFLKLLYDHFRTDWPCHYSALDLKSFYGGMRGLDFIASSMTSMREVLSMHANANAHDAQADAEYQADLLLESFRMSGLIS